MNTQYYCGNKLRRIEVRDKKGANHKPILNGIDYLEVSSPDQKTLTVRFIHNLPGQENGVPPGPALSKDNVVIKGGVRVKDVRVESASSSGNILTLMVNTPGDFSTYTLQLVISPTNPAPPDGFDLLLSEVEFSFKVECPSDFDCKPITECPTERLLEPYIDYLAKDYNSFRQLTLDRLSTIMPDWRERNAADISIALVELMAYVGDQLSYYQDAVATEAYLGTSRKRISVRRHARLVDYRMNEGCNARAWIQFEVEANIELPKGTRILTQKQNTPVVVPPTEGVGALAAGSVVFETMHDVNLYPGYHELHFYTWSDRECCLPKGATKATLVGPLPNLREGDVLIFEEVLGPKTDDPADADPAHRHVVRLTQVAHFTDPLNSQQVVEIAWDKADALPFPLCISAFIENVSVARGNVVLADHGQSLRDAHDQILEEDLGPVLQHGPLTHAVPLPADFLKQPAASLLNYQPSEAKPVISLRVPATGEEWKPQPDLLASGKFDTDFVAEIDEDGRAHIRFGDDINGKQPSIGTTFKAKYRIGNGKAGNVGAETLGRVVTNETSIIRVRNPLPASGGSNPETVEEVRQFAPQAFRKQQRAVTEDDYARVAELQPEVQRAAATFRWTGSWHTVFVSIDRRDGLPVDAAFKRRIHEHLNFYRMAGHDLEVDGPSFVPLDIAMTVCVKTGYFRNNVKASLLEKFSSRLLPDGSRGFFHPDNWTFGQPVYLSGIYAMATAVAGVESVAVTRFQRWGKSPNRELENGVLPIGRPEIAMLDNDPNFPENGRIEFNLVGGK